MSLYNQILETYPDIDSSVFDQRIIVLQDDVDGLGVYIAKWEYSQPIPEGLTLGKPSA
jgi:hypothetical protein